MPRDIINRIARITSIKIILQCVQLAGAIFVIRLLSIGEYGLYVALVAYSTLTADISLRGLPNAIVSIAGRARDQEHLIRSTTFEAGRIAVRFFRIVAPVVIAAFLFGICDQTSSTNMVILAILSMIIAALIIFRKIAEAALVTERRGGVAISLQLVSEVFRLICLFSLSLVEVDLWWVLVVLVLSHALNLLLTVLCVGRVKVFVSDSEREEVLRSQTAPLVPGIIFASVQSQLLIFLASFLSSANGLAEVAVASRFAFFFAFLGALSNYLILPRLSVNTSNKVFLLSVIKWLLLYCSICLLIVLSVYYTFDLLLVVIGEEYQSVEGMLLFILSMHALNAISTLLWTVQVARKWIWRWLPYVSIPFILSGQFIMLIVLDLSDTRGMIIFGFFTALAVVFLRVGMLAYGQFLSHKTD